MDRPEKFNDVNLCAKCSREIPFGTSYYSITRQLEHYIGSSDFQEIEVEDSEEITTLCKSCGCIFDQDSFGIILQNLPVPGHEIRN